MFLVGLTGGISTGKSLVANHLKSLGVQIIDADLVAREVVEPGKRAWLRIRQEFGEGVFNSDGTLNRAALGQVIFSEAEKRKTLNAITHPEIYKSILTKCLRLFVSGHQFTVVDLPLLYESGKMVRAMHRVIVVSCDKSQQLERLMRRDGLSERDSLSRIDAQMSLEEKRRLADYVVDNGRDEHYTRDQVEAIVAELRQSRAHWKYRTVALLGAGLAVGILMLAGFGLYQVYAKLLA